MVIVATSHRLPGAARSDRPSASPRVAVLIPCFNDGALLDDALASLRDQEPCEVVVVDDGSTDPATASALERAAKGGATVLRQENAGPSRARMRALAATSAPLVLGLDADDELTPGALGRLADVLDGDPRLDAVWGDIETFGAFRARRMMAAAVDPWTITYLNDLPAAAMFRRTALEAIGGWSLDDGYEDWDLWMRFASSGRRGRNIGGTFHRYRQNAATSRRVGDARQHRRLMAVLRARNAGLYAARASNWRRSGAVWGIRLGLPLVGAMPAVDDDRRFRWEHFIAKTFDPRWRLVVDGVPEPVGLRAIVKKLRRVARRAARRIALR